MAALLLWVELADGHPRLEGQAVGRSIDGISDDAFAEAEFSASQEPLQGTISGEQTRFVIELGEGSARVSPGQNRTLYEVGKRLFDLVMSIALLAILSPLLIALGVLIKLTSAGPVLFRQERVGRHGERFYLLKYRTMVDGAHEEPHRRHTHNLASSSGGAASLLIEDDSRVTRIGTFLRKWSLDELPNLLNVVKGEMSLVGPRPLVPYELALHSPAHLHRLAVQPGITGLAQVNGRLHMNLQERAEVDIAYLHRRSFVFDLLMLLRTIPTLVRRPGA